MLFVIGDSHASCSFVNISNVRIHYIGPVTLKRVGVLEDDFVPNKVKEMSLTPEDILLFVFGEIDIRCYVKLYLDNHKNSTLESLLQKWTGDYANHISLMPTNGAQIGIMSVVPPATFSSAESTDWPVSGSDEERVIYTKKINELLKAECQRRNWIYLDVYSKYADKKGMLPLDSIYMSVHIKDSTGVGELISDYMTNLRPYYAKNYKKVIL